LKRNTEGVLLYVLKDVLKMMHPFIPFVTEKLFKEISDEETITLSSWPVPLFTNHDAITNFETIKEIITKVRNLRNEQNVLPSKALDINLVVADDNLFNVLNNEVVYLKKFLNTNQLKIEKTLSNLEETVLLTMSNVSIYVMKKDLIDPIKELEQLLKNKALLESEIQRSEALLGNETFISKAPKAKLDLEKEKYESYLKQYKLLLSKLEEHV
jgi:valyl-tRNA synthetase